MGSFIEKNVENIKPARAKKRKTVKKAEKPKGCKEIRNFFQKKHRNNEDGNDPDVTLVTICIDWDFLLTLYTFYLHLYTFFYLLKTFLQFHNTTFVLYLLPEKWREEKNKEDKIFLKKISWGFIFVNLPFPKFSPGFIFANRWLSNILRAKISPIKVMCFSSTSWERFWWVSVCNVSLIISTKNPCKLISSNCHYGFSYIEDNRNQAPLTLSVSPQQNWVMKNNTFHRVKSNMVFACFSCMKFCCFWDRDF